MPHLEVPGECVRAAVRYFFSPDVELDSFQSDDPDDFKFFLQAYVGPAGSEGEEFLEFTVCTPKALETDLAVDDLILGRGLVIVGPLTVSSILARLEKAIVAVEAPTWRELAGRLARLGRYEFEDFV
jgi:hypothetical protein